MKTNLILAKRKQTYLLIFSYEAVHKENHQPLQNRDDRQEHLDAILQV